MDTKLLLQIIGVTLGLLYLWLEYKANIWLWVVGAIMPVVHSILYFKQGLYADFSMQLYYILAAIYGLIVWTYHGKGKEGAGEKPALPIAHTPLRQVAPLVAVYALLHGAIYFILTKYTDSTVPFWDAMTTALAIVATWMLSRKYVEQWLVWLVVDIITVGLYIYKEIPVTATLYLIYCVLAVVGYRRWLRLI
ncbi:MAG: nicotinamide mononucleotide transporter [Alistipes sp.]|nr:nicotinamide mononucleotide transporter [Alistipes sp.]